MRIRRVLWLCLSGLLGWGLYLYLPPKPRWTIPENEVPLKINAQYMLTMEMDPPLHRQENVNDALGITWHGPVRLRDLATGTILGAVWGGSDVWLSCRISADFRLLLCERSDDQSVTVFHLLTGAKWTLRDAGHTYFSPQGTLIHAWLGDRDQLLDAATGRVVAEFPASYRQGYRFSADDSWAIFVGSEAFDDGIKAEWLLWRRDASTLAKGAFPKDWQPELIAPGAAQVALDARTMLLGSDRSDQILVWDVLRGEKRCSLATESRHGHRLIHYLANGKMVAIWWEPHLELFDLSTGQRIGREQHSGLIGATFSADGKLLAIIDDKNGVVVVDLPQLKERWRATGEGFDVGLLDSLSWLQGSQNWLVGRFSRNDGRKPSDAIVWDGQTGRELFRRVHADLSTDCRHSVRWQEPEGGAHHFPAALLRWLPWFKDRESSHVTVENVENGETVLRRMYSHPMDQGPPVVNWPVFDGSTLVLMCSGRDTEIWDLPPARHWLWILGLAALPWLSSMIRRKRSAPTADHPATTTRGPA